MNKVYIWYIENRSAEYTNNEYNGQANDVNDIVDVSVTAAAFIFFSVVVLCSTCTLQSENYMKKNFPKVVKAVRHPFS